MEPDPASPDQLADEGVRRLALAHLETARAARERMTASGDPEALHDYRVALRRLRSALRSYRREVRSTVSRQSRRDLDNLARATNRTRDLEVHLAWLESQATAAGEAGRPAIQWLTTRLERELGRAREEMLALDAQRFPALHERLHDQLSKYRATLRLDGDREGPTIAEAAARQLNIAARRLNRRLQRIPDETAEREIHQARIAAKHLRYLLEPFAPGLPGGNALVERLKSLQDAFGDAHDTHVFLPELTDTLEEAERDGRTELTPGLRMLAESLRARGSGAFERAARPWLLPGRRAFFDDVRRAGRALADHSPRGRTVKREYPRDGPPAGPTRRTREETAMRPLRHAIAVLSLASALLAALPARALSQDTTWLAAGARIRLQPESVDRWTVGELVASPGDSVRVRAEKSGNEVSVATPSIARLEVSRGRARQTMRGLWIGTAVGAIAGAAISYAAYTECEGFCPAPELGRGGETLLGGLLGGVFGLGIGALIGSSITTDRWHPVPQPWAPE